MELIKQVMILSLLAISFQAMAYNAPHPNEGKLTFSDWAIPTSLYDTIQVYTEDMSKAEQKALKAQAVDDWGKPTFTHETRVLIYDGPVSAVNWRRYDSEKWESVMLFPRFTIKSKWQFNIIYDWVLSVSRTHFQDRYYIVRNDHDIIDAAWAAAEHFERFTKLIGVPVFIDYMEVSDSKGRVSVVKDKGKSMTKPSKFSQIETGKKRL